MPQVRHSTPEKCQLDKLNSKYYKQKATYSYALNIRTVAEETTDYVFALFHFTLPVQHLILPVWFNAVIKIRYVWINSIRQLFLSALLSDNLIQTFTYLKFVLGDKRPQNPAEGSRNPESPEVIHVDLNLIIRGAVDSLLSRFCWA